MFDFYSEMVEDGSLVCLEEKYLGYVGSFDYVDMKIFLFVIDNVLFFFWLLFEKYVGEIDWRLLVVIVYQEFYWNL